MKASWHWRTARSSKASALAREGEAIGEVVFNTSMTGYQEILTDPSYEGQLVAMTYPQIGNVGVNPEDVESRKPFMRGFIVKEYTAAAEQLARHSAASRIHEANGIVGIQGIDTRSLVRHLRDHGAQEGIISTLTATPADACRQSQSFARAGRTRSGQKCTCAEAYDWNEGMWDLERRLQAARMAANVREAATAEGSAFAAPVFSVVAYDFGIKFNILRNLAESGCRVKVVPAVDAGRRCVGAQPRWNFSFQRSRRSRCRALRQR